MTEPILSSPPNGIRLRHATSPEDLAACFPVISQLRPLLKDADEWTIRALDMRSNGYRVLAAWAAGRVVAIAGYRVAENLIHARFLYVDDLVTDAAERGEGFGAALLKELCCIGADECCQRLVLDTAETNSAARRFYRREGLTEAIVGFVKPLEAAA